MPKTDTLADGRKLERQLQRQCGFQLAYVQGIGPDPFVLVRRFRSQAEAMQGHEVRQDHY